MKNIKKSKTDEPIIDPPKLEELETQLAQAQEEARSAQESERRAIADYQNLMRRTQDDRIKMVKLAGRSVIESLLQPFEHLHMATQQLKDQGLNMVYQQFQQALEQEGLEEIPVMGKEFDPHVMEVIDKQLVDDPSQVDKVVKVTQRGFTLNGEVIQHAKVILGVEA